MIRKAGHVLLNYFIADYLEMIIHCQVPLLEDFSCGHTDTLYLW